MNSSEIFKKKILIGFLKFYEHQKHDIYKYWHIRIVKNICIYDIFTSIPETEFSGNVTDNLDSKRPMLVNINE